MDDEMACTVQYKCDAVRPVYTKRNARDIGSIENKGNKRSGLRVGLHPILK